MTQVTAGRRERRQAPRTARQWSVEVKNASGQTCRGTSVDVSTRGMRFRVDRAIELRGIMFVTLDPADAVGPVWARFSIVREIGPGEYAIRFLDLPPKNVERLKGVVED